MLERKSDMEKKAMSACNPTFGRPLHGQDKPNPRKIWAALMSGEHHGHGPRHFRGPGGPDFGFGPPRGPYGRGGRRARRGDIRLAALLLLAEEPRNGYAIMQELEQRTQGLWRPSPGSVYPALSQLEDEGLINSSERDGGRVFEITDTGREHLAHRPADAPVPWEQVGEGVAAESLALFGQARQLAAAIMQIAQAGSPAQAEQAKAVLDEARRSIYRILADGDQ
jgi:DNA-binding PadR family transcriptional regulator